MLSPEGIAAGVLNAGLGSSCSFGGGCVAVAEPIVWFGRGYASIAETSLLDDETDYLCVALCII